MFKKKIDIIKTVLHQAGVASIPRFKLIPLRLELRRSLNCPTGSDGEQLRDIGLFCNRPMVKSNLQQLLTTTKTQIANGTFKPVKFSQTLRGNRLYYPCPQGKYTEIGMGFDIT